MYSEEQINQLIKDMIQHSIELELTGVRHYYTHIINLIQMQRDRIKELEGNQEEIDKCNAAIDILNQPEKDQ